MLDDRSGRGHIAIATGPHHVILELKLRLLARKGPLYERAGRHRLRGGTPDQAGCSAGHVTSPTIIAHPRRDILDHTHAAVLCSLALMMSRQRRRASM